jgi:hypothetical protein
MPLRLQNLPKIPEDVESFSVSVTFRKDRSTITTESLYITQKSMATLPEEVTFYREIVNGEYTDPLPLTLLEMDKLEPVSFMRLK